MFNIVLYQPEIPPNTGNVMRLCANTGCKLHLIRPLGFELEDRKLRRAGLDYREWASVQVHDTLEVFLATVQPPRLYAVSTRGTRHYNDVSYQADDALLFGPETRGLPAELLDSEQVSAVIRLPMVEKSRSLNLSNCVAVLTYEAWRQLGFSGER
ncbi:tRNA (cytidine(34)-2'-O)-methyltransferase [hydrothermal vent metagenome]|uniref:tRNA (Cytidine(34)-2'-O)-methyltransferase n=1 Tax=hydrothermal vent metagenome TaxID=652676 RepID=A0A3B0Y1W9_9ZZZZ